MEKVFLDFWSALGKDIVRGLLCLESKDFVSYQNYFLQENLNFLILNELSFAYNYVTYICL